MEKKLRSPKITVDTYHKYLDYLQQISFQRALSNYFFIFINTLIIVIGISLGELLYPQVFLSIFLSLIGIVLCVYWSLEIRESYVTNEVRFRILMEFERKYFGGGILSSEWDELGNFRFKRSPVFYISMARFLPLLFALVHLIQSILFIIFRI